MSAVIQTLLAGFADGTIVLQPAESKLFPNLAQELIQRAKEELLHELLQPNNILAIKEAGRFVSEEEVLSRLLQNAVLDKDDLLTKLRQMLVGENSEFYLKTEKTDKERAAEIAEIAERAAEMITEKARDLKMPRKEN